MARIDVLMPQMGESIAEGTVSKWLKKIGDHVKRDEPLFEISTDKVDAEIPAPAAGVLAEIKVQEGQTVPVQTLVAVIETDKSAPVPVAAPPAPAPPKAATPPAAASPVVPRPTPASPVAAPKGDGGETAERSEEHTSELQSQSNLVCRLLLEKKKVAAWNGCRARGARPVVGLCTHTSSALGVRSWMSG